MTCTWTRSLCGISGLVGLLALVLTGSIHARPVPESIATSAIEADISHLQKSLAKTPEKRAVGTIKATAMMLALNAQNLKQFELRDQALKVAAAVTAKDFAAAKTAAAGLKPGKPGTGEALKLHELHNYDLSEMMSIFRNGTVGGLNIEKDVRAQAKKVTDVKALVSLGTRISLAAEYSLLLPPGEAVGAKKQKWDDWCKEMGELGSSVAEEAAKGDKADLAGLSKKLKSVDANCTACHNVFRN